MLVLFSRQPLLQAAQRCPGALQVLRQRIRQFALFLHRCRQPAHGLQRGFLGGARRAQLLERFLQLLQFGLARGLLRELGVDLRQTALDLPGLLLDLPAARGGAGLIDLPHLQAQDAPQHFLAPGGVLLGELVGLALQEKGGIDECIVIEAQRLLDARLRLADGAFGEGAPGLAVQHLELQQGAFAARQRALDAVGVPFIFEC